MTAAQWIVLALKISLTAIVLSIGLSARMGTVAWLLGKPGLLARSLLSMNVILPLVAACLVAVLDLKPAVAVALVALSVSPVPPILPKKQSKAGGRASYAVALLAVSALLAIVFVPAALQMLALVFGRPVNVPLVSIARIVATTVLAPLLAGMALRALVPASERIARPLSLAATVALLLGLVPVLVVAWPNLLALVGDFTLLAIVALAGVGLAVGHAFGGPDREDRTVLALSTAARHPGVAVAIARAAAPQEKSVVAAVLLACLVGALVSVPYVTLRRRAQAGAVAP